jgi:hypothetical protein
VNICADARPFYGDLYRIHANLAMSINNKCHYSLLWLYGLYTVLHSLSEIEQVLLMALHRLAVSFCSLSPALAKQIYIFRWLLSTKPRLLSSRTCFPDLSRTASKHYIGAPLLQTRQRRRRLLYARAILFRIEVQSIQNRNLGYLGPAILLTHGS